MFITYTYLFLMILPFLGALTLVFINYKNFILQRFIAVY